MDRLAHLPHSKCKLDVSGWYQQVIVNQEQSWSIKTFCAVCISLANPNMHTVTCDVHVRTVQIIRGMAEMVKRIDSSWFTWTFNFIKDLKSISESVFRLNFELYIDGMWPQTFPLLSGGRGLPGVPHDHDGLEVGHGGVVIQQPQEKIASVVGQDHHSKGAWASDVILKRPQRVQGCSLQSLLSVCAAVARSSAGCVA